MSDSMEDLVMSEEFTPTVEVEDSVADDASNANDQEGEENIQEIEDSSVDDESNANDQESEKNISKDFDEAYRRAQEELQASATSLAQQKALLELEQNAPRQWQFEELPEDVQQRVLDEAVRAGIDAQTVLYLAYKDQERAFYAQRATLQHSLEGRRTAAFSSVADFIHGDKTVASLQPEEKQKFIDSIGQLRAVKAIESLANIDPFAWAEAVKDIAGNAIAALTASRKQDPAKAHRAMKASVASGKSVSQKVQTTASKDPLEGMDLQSSSWDKRLKAAK